MGWGFDKCSKLALVGFTDCRLDKETCLSSVGWGEGRYIIERSCLVQRRIAAAVAQK